MVTEEKLKEFEEWMNTCEISKPYKNSSASKENGVVI